MGLQEYGLPGPIQRAADRRRPLLHFQRRAPEQHVSESVSLIPNQVGSRFSY